MFVLGVPWARMPSELTPEQWKSKMNDAMVAGLKNINELMKNAQNGDKSGLNSKKSLSFLLTPLICVLINTQDNHHC